MYNFQAEAPSVINLEEVDAILSSWSDSEHESRQKTKTEFLVQLDGVSTGHERVLFIGATNRPQVQLWGFL